MKVTNVTEAQTFLSILNTNGSNLILQTFDDSERKDPSLVTTRVGSFDVHIDALIEKNNRGAGVFVTVNESRSNRRIKADIIRCRGVWQEDDTGTDNIPELEPTIVIETSPGKYHRYWLLDNPTPDVQTWEKIQNSLVSDWDSDSNAKDLCRVMRVPGFYHCKGTPYRSKILSDTLSPKYYTLKELADYFIKVEKEPSTETDSAGVDDLFDPMVAIRAILSEDNFHGSQISLALHYANMGMSVSETSIIIQSFFKSVKDKGPRWAARYEEIGAAVRSAVEKVEEEIAELHEQTPEKYSLSDTSKYLKLTRPPGVLGEVVDNILEFMPKQSMEIAISAALFSTNVYAGSG
ncbi:MAG: hypothetical protein DRP42_04480, partial [Tenericutes bacterium]